MNDTTIDVTGQAPLAHDEAMALLGTELDRTLDLLRTLDADEWATATDCPDWDVRRMYLHVLGACEAGASLRENVHQLRHARRYQHANGGPLEAALSAVQVRDRIALGPDELVDRFERVAPRTVRRRTTLPVVVRDKARMKVDGPVFETWTLGYLIDTIYLRDLWMHRVDVSRATGRPLVTTADHDGRILADVVAEWARRHGRPCTLTLTGPLAATYVASGGGEPIEIDAVEFARTLAGRADGSGLLATPVPF